MYLKGIFNKTFNKKGLSNKCYALKNEIESEISEKMYSLSEKANEEIKKKEIETAKEIEAKAKKEAEDAITDVSKAKANKAAEAAEQQTIQTILEQKQKAEALQVEGEKTALHNYLELLIDDKYKTNNGNLRCWYNQLFVAMIAHKGTKFMKFISDPDKGDYVNEKYCHDNVTQSKTIQDNLLKVFKEEIDQISSNGTSKIGNLPNNESWNVIFEIFTDKCKQSMEKQQLATIGQDPNTGHNTYTVMYFSEILNTKKYNLKYLNSDIDNLDPVEIDKINGTCVMIFVNVIQNHTLTKDKIYNNYLTQKTKFIPTAISYGHTKFHYNSIIRSFDEQDKWIRFDAIAGFNKKNKNNLEYFITNINHDIEHNQIKSDHSRSIIICYQIKYTT